MTIRQRLQGIATLAFAAILLLGIGVFAFLETRDTNAPPLTSPASSSPTARPPPPEVDPLTPTPVATPFRFVASTTRTPL